MCPVLQLKNDCLLKLQIESWRFALTDFYGNISTIRNQADQVHVYIYIDLVSEPLSCPAREGSGTRLLVLFVSGICGWLCICGVFVYVLGTSLQSHCWWDLGCGAAAALIQHNIFSPERTKQNIGSIGKSCTNSERTLLKAFYLLYFGLSMPSLKKFLKV